jgi:iron(III) transport system ATP-binding protein
MSVCVKTHDLELVPVASAGTRGNNVLPGVVRSQAYLGSHRDYIVDVGQEVLISTRPDLEVATGSQAAVRFDAQRCRGLSR